MKLNVTLLDITKVKPNTWNPNVQNERQFTAEIESILSNGFLAPILVRKEGDTYQIIDGEHRYKALNKIIEDGKTGVKNVGELVSSKKIPSIVIDVDEVHAKRLTIIMNETRGRADLAKLGDLLNAIAPELGDNLIEGLPYTPTQLEELMDIAEFDWESLSVPVSDEDLSNDEEEEGQYKVAATLSPDAAEMWKETLRMYKDELPKDPKRAAGIVIGRLLEKSQA